MPTILKPQVYNVEAILILYGLTYSATYDGRRNCISISKSIRNCYWLCAVRMDIYEYDQESDSKYN